VKFGGGEQVPQPDPNDVAFGADCHSTHGNGIRSGLIRLHGRAVGAELERLPPRVFELRAHVCRDKVAALDSLEAVSL
jgi:hypothetical protein